MSNLKFRYETVEFQDFDIHIKTLKDKQQFSDDMNEAKDLGINSTLWSMFGTVWPAGRVLATLMSTYNISNKKILELGCGIGLSSLVLNKRGANIVATDYHPEVVRYLKLNTELNEDKEIKFFQSDWNNEDINIGQYDTIIGSDLLYEDEHAFKVAKFITVHASEKAEVFIVGPDRGLQKKFDKEMQLMGFESTKIKPIDLNIECENPKILIYHYKTV